MIHEKNLHMKKQDLNYYMLPVKSYNFSGEKIVNKLNKEEKELRKYNGNYLCLKYEHSNN